MADMRNRTPFYGAVPTSRLNADHVFMSDGSTLQEQADKKFELIEEITLTEDTSLIERTTEPDGTTYNFESVFIETNIEPATVTDSGILTVNNTILSRIQRLLYLSTRAKSDTYCINYYGMFLRFCSNSAQGDQYSNSMYITNTFKAFEPITKIKLQPREITEVMPTGSIIKIYAVRV